jgi:hypothetical protein
MTYEQIIAKATRQRLNTKAPHLRLLPPAADPELQELTNAEIIKWARERSAKRGRFITDKTPVKRDPAQLYLLNRGGAWYYHRHVNGKLVTISLRTRDLDEARRRRDELVSLTPGGQP